MNTKDKDSLTALLNYTKEYQSISREIHWTFSDSERLDDLANSKDLQKDIANRIKRLGQRKSAEFIVPFFLAYKAWQRTKAVYSFNQKLIADLANADDTNIYISLLERLPFKDMLFFFPEGDLTKFDNEEIAGVYVHIERHPEFLWILINNLNRNPDNKNQILPGFGIAFPISNGMKISDIFKTPQYLDWLSSHKRQMAFNPLISEQKLEETILSEKKALNTVINCLYYLSAENADIKEIKNRKKLKKLHQAQTEIICLQSSFMRLEQNMRRLSIEGLGTIPVRLKIQMIKLLKIVSPRVPKPLKNDVHMREGLIGSIIG